MLIDWVDIPSRRSVDALEISIGLSTTSRFATDLLNLFSLALETYTVLPFSLVCNCLVTRSHNVQKSDKSAYMLFGIGADPVLINISPISIIHFHYLFSSFTFPWNMARFFNSPVLFSVDASGRVSGTSALRIVHRSSQQSTLCIERCSYAIMTNFALATRSLLFSVIDLEFFFFLSHFFRLKKKKGPQISDLQRRFPRFQVGYAGQFSNLGIFDSFLALADTRRETLYPEDSRYFSQAITATSAYMTRSRHFARQYSIFCIPFV